MRKMIALGSLCLVCLAGCGRPAPAVPAVVPPPPKPAESVQNVRWEYRTVLLFIVRHDRGQYLQQLDVDGIDESLGNAGVTGWELVCVGPSDVPDVQLAYFKRRAE